MQDLECVTESGPDTLGGQLVFKGTRVPVAALFDNMMDGASINEFLQWFPGVERQQVETLLKHNRTVDIYALIERIRPRPALYLGSASLSRLDSFLNGYRAALGDLNVEVAGMPPFVYFHDWVAMKLGKYEGTAGWSRLLLESTNGDEEGALEQFFVFLDEFRQRKGRVILQGVPYKNSAWWCEVDPITAERRPLEKPVLVQIVKYTDDKGVFLRYLGADRNPVYREEYCQDLKVAYLRTESLVEKNGWQAPENLSA